MSKKIITWKKATFGLAAILLLLVGWAASVLLQPNEENATVALAFKPHAASISLPSALRRASATAVNLPSRFPYKSYLDSTDFSDARRLALDAQALDSLFPASAHNNERLLYTALTDSLSARWMHSAQADTMAHLLSIMTWASQLPVAARFEPRRATFFRALNLYWVKQVATSLEQQYRRNPNIKYAFQFKHLNQLCRDAKCGVPVSFSASEKVINNVVEGQWGYLLTKFLRDSSLPTRLGAGLFVALFLLTWLAFFYTVRQRFTPSLLTR
ncbi:hypothetical protein [Hymenobacter terricola]|uniref:hypothetical protein n=1 Tax=Hymenobacter terricola TaxID=2819236 RepID=UPI001B30AAE2|nr:hypothetical protein [Hymenobacter terricola]